MRRPSQVDANYNQLFFRVNYFLKKIISQQLT
jgi:hypothetical protein